MGLLLDALNGFIAVLAAVVGQIIAAAIVAGLRLPLMSIILALIGLFIAGFGFKRRGTVAAVIVGVGLGFAAVIVSMIYSYI